jgi:hypothetical protein
MGNLELCKRWGAKSSTALLPLHGNATCTLRLVYADTKIPKYAGLAFRIHALVSLTELDMSNKNRLIKPLH